MNGGLRRASAAGLTVLLGLGAAAGCTREERPATRAGGAATTSLAPAQGAAQLEQQYERVIRTVLPSVVQIDTGTGEGSGVVYDTAGHIVTNAHVVAGAEQVRVVPASGGRPIPGTVVGAFAADDLAVVRVNGGNLPPAAFGDSTKVRVGQIVLAMGNPLGLSGSVTQGIVSATGRSVTTGREGDFPGSTIADAIQTSAAINPGNSGGALVTLSGQVIGIPTAAAGNPQGGAAPGIGFATPSATVKRIVPQLVRQGRVTDSGRAALGVTVRTVVDLRTGEPVGVGVVSVSRGGGAERAGVRPGDVIVRVNDVPTPTQAALSQVLAGLDPGNVARVVLLPGGSGEERTVDVTLGELPGD
ncbi:S1C family serine protease [Thermomonospora cellulosilytica]|uniref:S1-C subfamily serine protease n=1 Tax=Thermomonospora cellulosilytica TaxID=1411118 RepID=A0A7W3N377_9ACTN|nr:trypsin-like peptidase domain-containing protein [Thermomonospora cellulosilytica]MBA9006743.1 S1-C subfamily serine protease [Thermomonospora cellulosilytica]